MWQVPRAGGEIWVGGTHELLPGTEGTEGDRYAQLPPPGQASLPTPYVVSALRQAAVEVCPQLGGVADHVSHAACLRPCTADGLPILGRVGGGRVLGCIVASGLGPWGVLCAPSVRAQPSPAHSAKVCSVLRSP